jgi:hypothetical protein
MIFSILSNNNSFEVKYTKMKSGNEYFTIYNNKGDYCIRIKKDIEESNKIYLEHRIFFHVETKTIEMLLAILQYVNNFYGKELDLKYIFQDYSSINILGHTLKLNLIYILLYGVTWYMKNLNAFCISEEFNINLQIINNYLDTHKDDLYKFFIKSLEINNENNNMSENIISQDFINLISKNNEIITK